MADVTVRDLRMILGEGIHVAFRKAGQSRNAHTAWQAISDMDMAEWEAIVDFVADGLGEALLLPRGEPDGG